MFHLFNLEARSSEFLGLVPNLDLNCLDHFGSIGVELGMLVMNVVLPQAFSPVEIAFTRKKFIIS